MIKKLTVEGGYKQDINNIYAGFLLTQMDDICWSSVCTVNCKYIIYHWQETEYFGFTEFL